MWLGKLVDFLNMTIAVELDFKHQNKQIQLLCGNITLSLLDVFTEKKNPDDWDVKHQFKTTNKPEEKKLVEP